MWLFRRYHRERKGVDDSYLETDEYRSSGDLRFAKLFANMVAHDRGSQTIEATDLLAGIYLAGLEKVGQYWTDWENFESLIERECGIRDPRWLYWMRAYDAMTGRTRGSFIGHFKPSAEDTKVVFQAAVRLLPPRTGEAGRHVLNSKHLLLALATSERLPISRKIVESGLDLGRLRAAFLA